MDFHRRPQPAQSTPSASSQSSLRIRLRSWKMLGAIAILTTLAVVLWATMRDKIGALDLSLLLADTPYAVPMFIAAHMVAAMAGVPGTALVVTGGVRFGMVWGTIWSLLGATLGAVSAFYLARSLLRERVYRRFHDHPLLQRINQLSDRHALPCVLSVRFIPVSPFTVVNFLFGLTVIDVKPFALGTAIGIIPGTLGYTWLGVTGRTALFGGNIAPLALGCTALTGLTFIPLWLYQRRRRPPP